MQYLILIEKTATGYSAYSPNLDGCVATGPTNPRASTRSIRSRKGSRPLFFLLR